jgi:hypothetical protein
MSSDTVCGELPVNGHAKRKTLIKARWGREEAIIFEGLAITSTPAPLWVPLPAWDPGECQTKP